MGVQRLGEGASRTGLGRGAGFPERRREGPGRSESSDGGRAAGPWGGCRGCHRRMVPEGPITQTLSRPLGAVAMPESKFVFEAAQDPEFLHGLTLVSGVAADAGASELVPVSHGAWGSAGAAGGKLLD